MTWKDKATGEVYRTYKDLFKYVERKCNFHYKRKNDPESLTFTCHGDLRFTEAFCKRHKLDFQRVKHILEFFGGFCDCEILLNVDTEEHEDMWKRNGTMILEDRTK